MFVTCAVGITRKSENICFKLIMIVRVVGTETRLLAGRSGSSFPVGAREFSLVLYDLPT